MKRRKKKSKIGTALRIRLPNDYNIPRITDYDPNKYNKENLKKWCVEQALKFRYEDNETENVLKISQKIYKWVSK